MELTAASPQGLVVRSKQPAWTAWTRKRSAFNAWTHQTGKGFSSQLHFWQTLAVLAAAEMMWERLRRSGSKSRVSSATLISRRQSSPTQNGQDRFTDPDPRLAQLDDDPRSKDSPLGKAQRAALGERGLSGRNSASFDPKSTLVRPAMRVLVGSSQLAEYKNELRHDDVVIVPDFYCAEDDWQVYYDLIREMRKLQEKKIQDSQWKSWHEGAHLLSPNPEGSKTYQKIIARMCEYFSIAAGTRGTRFNWYRDGSDWKPFHHDSAAFNAKRARNQNCTVGISFGASRELAFRHANNGDLVYFPQTNGMLFFFGRDVNIRWQHGINALPRVHQDGKGRISIILWGHASKVIEEADSPPMLADEDRRGTPTTSMTPRIRRTCRDFLRGNCRYGERCKFAHVRDVPIVAGGQRAVAK